jgi:hypothetical protein
VVKNDFHFAMPTYEITPERSVFLDKQNGAAQRVLVINC